MKKKNLLIISTVLLVISACSQDSLSSPAEAPSSDTAATPMATSIALTFEAKDSAMATSVASTFEANDSVVATSVASTLEANGITATSLALTLEAKAPETQPQSTDIPTSTPTGTPTSVASPTASLTPMPTDTVAATSSVPVPIISVSVETNCRTGPGKVYDRVGYLKVGENAEVVGKKTSYNYWIIKNPDANGDCWLWGEYATVLGDTSNLEEYTLPSALPSAPPSTASPTPTVTTISSPPMISVSVGTNCRTGPGKTYAYIGELRVGEKAEVVGKKTSYNYWIIKNPDADGECWLWGEYATVLGDTSSLQEYTVPPTPPSKTTTSSAPMVGVSVGTNCRTGPSVAYDIIGGLRVGENAEVVGKNTSYKYWIIKNPDENGSCWLWGYYATVVGDTNNLQEYTVPPIP